MTSTLPFLHAAAGGLMGDRMRAFDWSKTPVGACEGWPQSLKSAIATLLECRLPMYIAWGPHFIQFYNDAYRPILGAKDVDALGNSAPVTWHEIWPTIGPMWQKVLAGEAIGFDDFKLTIQRFGYPEDCYFNFSYSPVRDDDGTVQGVLVTFAETTQRVLSERRLRFLDDHSQATRDVADPAAAMHITASMLGRYLGANRCVYARVLDDPNTFELLGDYTDGVASMVGQYTFDDFGSEVRELLLRNEPYVNEDVDADAATSGSSLPAYRQAQIRSFVCVPLHKHGRFVAAMAVHQATPRRWSRDEVELVRTIADRCWESLERLRVDAELREQFRSRALLLESERAARLQAERASAVKDEFLSTLSHELRTPLSAITGWVHVLRRKSESLNQDVLRGLDVIESSTRTQVQLIDDLLDMSRIATGKLHLQLEPLAPATFVTTALEVIQPTADAAGVRLTSDLDVVGLLQGDATRLQQVVLNLLVNAVKFTPRGGHVHVELREAEGQAVIEVTDTGIGIRPEFLANLFQRFQQADGTITRRFGGLGLGLSIAHNLVQLHGGTIEAHSDGEGRGSRFTVRLPLRSFEADNAAATGITRWEQHLDLTGRRILVVDDDPNARELLKRIFEDAGAHVHLAERPDAALTLLREHPHDILLSDIGMPGTDGYELLRLVRALPPGGGGDVPAIALTAFARPEDRDRALQAGFAKHVTKPMKPVEVLAAVADVLAGT